MPHIENPDLLSKINVKPVGHLLNLLKQGRTKACEEFFKVLTKIYDQFEKKVQLGIDYHRGALPDKYRMLIDGEGIFLLPRYRFAADQWHAKMVLSGTPWRMQACYDMEEIYVDFSLSDEGFAACQHPDERIREYFPDEDQLVDLYSNMTSDPLKSIDEADDFMDEKHVEVLDLSDPESDFEPDPEPEEKMADVISNLENAVCKLGDKSPIEEQDDSEETMESKERNEPYVHIETPKKKKKRKKNNKRKKCTDKKSKKKHRK